MSNSAINSEAEHYFASIGGALLYSTEVCRPNFERQIPPRDGMIRALTLHVALPPDLLGIGGDYLEDVHPRINALRSRFVEHLAAKNIYVAREDSPVQISFMPYPYAQVPRGTSLPKLDRPSRGSRICDVAELTAHSPYYAALVERFPSVRYGVITSNGTVVGPDGGLIGAAAAAAHSFGCPVRLAELGTGAGGTALALFGRGQLARYWTNDFSPEVAAWFDSTLKPSLHPSVDVSFEAGSCFDVSLTGVQADILSVGVYYQAQPSLFSKRGKELSAIIGEAGILIAQTGMLEDALVPAILLGRGHLRGWPWHDPHTSVHQWFRYVAEVLIEDERVLLASNNQSRIYSTIEALGRDSSSRNLELA